MKAKVVSRKFNKKLISSTALSMELISVMELAERSARKRPHFGHSYAKVTPAELSRIRNLFAKVIGSELSVFIEYMRLRNMGLITEGELQVLTDLHSRAPELTYQEIKGSLGIVASLRERIKSTQ